MSPTADPRSGRPLPGSSEEDSRWRALLDAASAPLGLLDQDGRCLFASARLTSLLGTSADRIGERCLTDFLHEDDRSAFEAAMKLCRQCTATVTVSLRPHGVSDRWIEAHLSNRLHERALRGIVLSIEDFTAQHAVEERHAALFSVAPVGIAQLGTDRRIQYVNDRLCEILGRARDELVGSRLKDFSHPEDNPLTENAVSGLIQTRTLSAELEKRFVRADGGVVWARLTMSNPRDPRFLQQRVVVIEDISARREAELRLKELTTLHEAERARSEEALRASESALRRFRTALDRSSELISLVEAGTGRLLDFNDSVCETLGYRREELIGQSLDIIVTGRTPEEIRARNRALLLEPERRDQIRRTYRRKDGSTIEVEVVRQVVQSPDGAIVVAIGRDLTRRMAAQARVRESEERFRQLVEHIPQVFWVLELGSGQLSYISPHHAQLFGRKLGEDGTLRSWIEAVHEEDREDAAGLLHGTVVEAEYRIAWPNGHLRWVHTSASSIRDDQGVAVRLACISEDITARKAAERRMREQARHEQCIARFGKLALGEKDLDQLMASAVDCVQSGLGLRTVLLCEFDEVRAKMLVRASSTSEVTPGREAAIPGAMQLALVSLERCGNYQRGEAEALAAVLPEQWTANAMSAAVCPVLPIGGRRLMIVALSEHDNAFSEEDAGFLEAVSSLISTALQRHESETRLAYLAQFDSLTGLANRSLLRDRLAQAVAQAERQEWSVAVLFVDLDRFKLINDTHGHAMGDALLAESSRRLRDCVRGGDTVGRISGDEFAVVLADLAKPDDAAIVARKILDALAQPFQLGAHETFVSASVGIAIFPADGMDADTLLKNADTAMYRAKEAGRNGFCFFTAEMNRRSQRRLQLAGELRRAIERAEFRLHYQPKVDLAGARRLCGMEALLRWSHPERGLIPPDVFIPVLEETGLIMPVGEWVLNEACRQVRAWHDAGLVPVPVAVNLSARQFREKELERIIHDCTRSAGISTQFIELEITESHLMEEPDAARRVLQGLREAGIRISVDDFGTGYSSLAYLTKFPLNSLKVDRSFVRDLNTDASADSIVRAIINMARSLEFTTIAEGVETELQAGFLRDLGCDQAQGFLYAPALSPEAAAGHLAKARTLPEQYQV